MRSKVNRLSVVMWIVALAACQGTAKETSFLSLYQGVPMNQALRFREPSDEFQIGEPLSLDLENTSSHEIGISVQDGIAALVLQDHEWTELQNGAVYLPPDAVRLVVPRATASDPFTAITLLPRLDNLGRAVQVRVAVVGFVYVDGQKTGQREGAFIDVFLRP